MVEIAGKVTEIMAIRKGKRSGHQAPGRSDRNGLSLKEVFLKFPTNAKAEKWFQDEIWQGTPYCPHCESTNIVLKTTHPDMPHRCRDCRKFFSIKTGTVMEASKVSYQDWAIAYYLYHTNLKGISSMRLHRELKVTQRTAWFILQRLREADGEIVRFKGVCEVDETYVGGKTSRMNSQQYASWKKKTGGGRGGKGKEIIGCIIERESGRVQMAQLPDNKAETVQKFIVDRIEEDTEIQTDEFAGYNGIDKHCRKHETVNHKLFQFVRYDGLHYITTNACESAHGRLKASIVGVYHCISAKHLSYYLNELTGKQNRRDLDTIDQMAEHVRSTVGKRIRYEDLTARTPEQEEAYAARNYEKFGLEMACREAAGLTALDDSYRRI